MTSWNQGKPLGVESSKTFVDQDNPFSGLRMGVISRVDPVSMRADVALLSGGPAKRYETPITATLAGPRSFWGGVPEEGSLVLCAFRRQHRNSYELHILACIPVGNKIGLRFDPFGIDDPSTLTEEDQALYTKVYGPNLRYKRLFLRPGDVGGMSSAGSELVLSRDIRMTNRAGDLFELRDAERSLVIQAVHQVVSTGASFSYSGPIRRQAFLVPPELLTEGAFPETGFYGLPTWQGRGAGLPGSVYKYAGQDGKAASFLNDPATTPVTFSNHRRASYSEFMPGELFEDGESSGLAFTEHRLEVRHVSNLTPDVLDEIDGFGQSRPARYIEAVYGTVVGNDPDSAQGQRQYGKVLRPRIFTDFLAYAPGDFALEEVGRSPGSFDEAKSLAGGYLFRLQPPGANQKVPFAVSVNKQGKLFVNVPKPPEDKALGEVSAEVNLLGALKFFIGASNPTNTSIHGTLQGGVKLDIGHNTEGDSQGGNAVDVTYHSAVKQTFRGNGNDQNLAVVTDVQGNVLYTTTGERQEVVGSSYLLTVSGKLQQQADRINQNAFSGYSGNFGELNLLVAGKSQYQYALQVIETIIAGGKASTILAGGVSETVLAGAKTTQVLGGAMSTTVAAGAYAVSVGAGSLTLTTASGILALTAGAGALTATAGGALAMTAGLAITLTASAAISLVSSQVLLGGPAAILGVCRGAPVLPPGVPTLDLLTGLPLPGCAVVRSILCL